MQGLKGFFSFLTAPMVGALSDVWGRRVFLLVTVGATCLPLAFLLFDNLWWHVVATVLCGPFAVTFSIVFAYVSDVTDEHSRSAAFGQVCADCCFHAKLFLATTQRNAMQHNTTQRNATQRNATQCNTAQRNATQRNATQCNTAQRNATQRNATQRNATQRNTTQRNATQRNATQRNATQRKATQRKLLVNCQERLVVQCAACGSARVSQYCCCVSLVRAS
jgi:hypothetical protein